MIVAFAGGLFDIEKGFARNPAVGHCLVPALAVLALSYYHVEAVVFKVERLARALYAVTYHCYGFVLKCFECF